jgi:hypothetical protein
MRDAFVMNVFADKDNCEAANMTVAEWAITLNAQWNIVPCFSDVFQRDMHSMWHGSEADSCNHWFINSFRFDAIQGDTKC